jgi:hypothetical protein
MIFVPLITKVMSNNLEEHARSMRLKVYKHMVKTRGWKYSAFLRYLRLFKYAAFSPVRGGFLESYYTLMRYIDDIVDGDLDLPEKYSDAVEYISEKIVFSENPVNPKDEVDFLMIHCFELADKFGEDFKSETKDILESLLFDAKRREKLIIFPERDLIQHFHILDVRGTIKATLKVFKEDPDKYIYLDPLGMACRYQFDLEDFEADINAGYVNLSKEECDRFDISIEDLQNINSPGIKKWFEFKARKGLDLLEEYHRRLPKGKFSLLARATFPLVYEYPARRVFRKVLSSDGTVRQTAFKKNNPQCIKTKY